MSKEINSNTGGVGIGSILFIVFLTLKLCNVIDWKWIWVFSPIWMPAGLAIIGIIIIGVIKSK